MPTVTVKPSGIRFAAARGQTIMAAGEQAGYRWPTICEGNAQCLVCHIEVLEHPDHLRPPEDTETQAIRGLPGGRGSNVRLACQAVVEDNVVVLKRGVRARTGAPAGEQVRP